MVAACGSDEAERFIALFYHEAEALPQEDAKTVANSAPVNRNQSPTSANYGRYGAPSELDKGLLGHQTIY
jgi:hypothetical protein